MEEGCHRALAILGEECRSERFSGAQGNDDREVDRVEWFPIDKAITSASYPQEKTVLRKAKELMAV